MSTSTTDRATITDPEASSSAPRIADHSLGLLVVRVILGVIMIGHGAQKLFGAFGGSGIDGTAKFFASVGYSPSTPMAVLAGLIEFAGGIALVAGLAASAAAAAIAADMAGALAVKADGAKGAFFAMNGGYEYELLLMLVAFGLALTGPGRLALDDGRVWNRPMLRRVFAALAVVGGVVAVVIR